MAIERQDFSTYSLGALQTSEQGVYGMADGLIPEMAQVTGYDLEAADSREAALQGLIGHVGKMKELQLNLDQVRERLQAVEDPITVASTWNDQSGHLQALDRSFAEPNVTVPKSFDYTVMSDGVTRWPLRRMNRLIHHAIQGRGMGRVILAFGDAEAKPNEHKLAADYAARNDGRLPKRYEIGEEFIAPALRNLGIDAEVVRLTGGGDQIMDNLVAQHPELLKGTTLVAGNAPSAIQSAGTFRWAARKADAGYDTAGDQVFMTGDTIPLARNGEAANTHQNPLTGIQQIPRNALYLQRNLG